MAANPDPDWDLTMAEEVRLGTDAQLRAMNNHTRHQILVVLRDGPATVTQIAARMDIAKGSSSHHVRLLREAGLIKLVGTRKVRGVMERYYQPAARRIVLPDPVPGDEDPVLRHAIADLAAAPAGTPRLVRMTHVRIDEDRFAEFEGRLSTLLDDLRATSEPGQRLATLAFAYFRPTAAEAGAVAGPDDEDPR